MCTHRIGQPRDPIGPGLPGVDELVGGDDDGCVTHATSENVGLEERERERESKRKQEVSVSLGDMGSFLLLSPNHAAINASSHQLGSWIPSPCPRPG